MFPLPFKLCKLKLWIENKSNGSTSVDAIMLQFLQIEIVNKKYVFGNASILQKLPYILY